MFPLTAAKRSSKKALAVSWFTTFRGEEMADEMRRPGMVGSRRVA
jgi:hypothetical protein